MEKILRRLIEYGLRGVDTYTYNGSTWLIFTDNKQWVIELTDNKTLWYNYNFFKQLFCVATDDVIENQKHITKWVENNLINKKPTCVTHFRDARDRKQQFEDTLENGVKNTDYWGDKRILSVEDTLGNGVKNTKQSHIDNQIQERVEGTLENGVRHTKMAYMKTDWSVEDTIENGVKKTNYKSLVTRDNIGDIIDGGVKETKGTLRRTLLGVDDIIQDGVRDTQYSEYENQKWIDGVIKGGVKETIHVDVMKFFDNKMEDTLDNGVKETKQKNNALLILDNSGRELILESHLVIRDGVKITSPLQSCEYTGDIDEVLGDGVRTSHPRQYVGENIIDKIIDKGVIETHDDVYHHKGRIDGVIKNGVKETINWSDSIDGDLNQNGCIDNVINDGVKETKTPGWDGDIISTVEWLNENNSTSYSKMINDVIENGVKETVAAGYTDPKTNILHIKWGDQIDDVIDNGVKETNVGKRDWTITTNDVIQEGVKETKSIGKGAPNYPRPVINHIIKNGEKINGTYVGGQRQSEKCKSVVEYGTKNPPIR